MVKSGWVKICRKVVKVLNLEGREPQLLVFWFHGLKGMSVPLVLFLIRNPLHLKTYLGSPEDLGKVTCNWLGRMSLPLGTQEGSFGPEECFSLRQRSMSLPRDRT